MHARQRQTQWEHARDVTAEVVEGLLKNPPQVVPGDQGLQVAQMPWKDGLIRAPYAEEPGRRRVVTVYWTSRVDKYWVKSP